MAGKQDEFRFFSDDWGRPSPEQRAANRQIVASILQRPSPEQRAINRSVVGHAMQYNAQMLPTSAPLWAHLLGSVGLDMMESGGESPPKVAAPTAPAQPKTATAQAATPMSPLERILTNMAKADPNGGISLGALRKLGSVFPGTPPTTKTPSMADVAGYQAMQLEDQIFQASLNAARNAKSQAEADEIYTKAIERQINLNKALAGVKNSDEAMAKLFK